MRPDGETREAWLVWWLSALFPLLLTLLYFQVLAGGARWAQVLVYAPGKFLQFIGPGLWAGWREGWRPRLPRPAVEELLLGAGSGVLIAGLAWLGYRHAGLPEEVLAQLRDAIGARLHGLGLDGPVAFMLLGVFYATVHSGLEEFYWRWFVYGRAQRLFTPFTAVLAASLAFAAHHVVVLAGLLGYASVWTWALSAAVAAGGALWCWMVRRYASLWGAWLSHALVDAALFAIGHDLLTSS